MTFYPQYKNAVTNRYAHSMDVEGCLATNEWVIVDNTNSAIFQLYYGKNKLIFNEMMMRSALF